MKGFKEAISQSMPVARIAVLDTCNTRDQKKKLQGSSDTISSEKRISGVQLNKIHETMMVRYLRYVPAELHKDHNRSQPRGDVENS